MGQDQSLRLAVDGRRSCPQVFRIAATELPWPIERRAGAVVRGDSRPARFRHVEDYFEPLDLKRVLPAIWAEHDGDAAAASAELCDVGTEIETGGPQLPAWR